VPKRELTDDELRYMVLTGKLSMETAKRVREKQRAMAAPERGTSRPTEMPRFDPPKRDDPYMAAAMGGDDLQGRLMAPSSPASAQFPVGQTFQPSAPASAIPAGPAPPMAPSGNAAEGQQALAEIQRRKQQEQQLAAAMAAQAGQGGVRQ